MCPQAQSFSFDSRPARSCSALSPVIGPQRGASRAHTRLSLPLLRTRRDNIPGGSKQLGVVSRQMLQGGAGVSAVPLMHAAASTRDPHLLFTGVKMDVAARDNSPKPTSPLAHGTGPPRETQRQCVGCRQGRRAAAPRAIGGGRGCVCLRRAAKCSRLGKRPRFPVMKPSARGQRRPFGPRAALCSAGA